MVTVPSLLLLEGFDKCTKYLYTDYIDRVNSYCFGYNESLISFDWQTTNESLFINGVEITLDSNLSGKQNIINGLNAKIKATSLLNKFEFYLLNNKINLRSILKTDTSAQSLILTEGTGLLSRLSLDVVNIKQGTLNAEITLLYQIYSQANYSNYNYLNSVVKLLKDTYTDLSNNNSPKLRFRLDYNQNVDNKPPIVIISLANEKEAEKYDISPNDNRLLNFNAYSVVNKLKRYSVNFKFNIISNNRADCEIIYILLQTICTTFAKIFDNFYGLKNMIFTGGGDTLAEIEVPDMFNRVFSLEFNYDCNYPLITDKRGLLSEIIAEPNSNTAI